MEQDKPSNTGKLIRAIWPDTRIVNWSRVAPDNELLERINDPAHQTVLVFPEQYAADEQKSVATDSVYGVKQPTCFIILDATWQQARKIYRQSPYFHSLPLFSLLPDQASVYTLRRNRNPQHLCTAEVAAQVLKQWGEREQGVLLEALVKVYCDQYLWARKGQRQVTDSPALALLTKVKKNIASL